MSLGRGGQIWGVTEVFEMQWTGVECSKWIWAGVCEDVLGVWQMGFRCRGSVCDATGAFEKRECKKKCAMHLIPLAFLCFFPFQLICSHGGHVWAEAGAVKDGSEN